MHYLNSMNQIQQQYIFEVEQIHWTILLQIDHRVTLFYPSSTCHLLKTNKEIQIEFSWKVIDVTHCHIDEEFRVEESALDEFDRIVLQCHILV